MKQRKPKPIIPEGTIINTGGIPLVASIPRGGDGSYVIWDDYAYLLNK